MFKTHLRKLMIDVLAPAISHILNAYGDPDEITQFLSAKVIINQIKQNGIYNNIQDTEFKVFSQFGDDGIIQYLISNVKLKHNEKRFIEFGVEDYRESNTRFLLFNNNWSGLVMEFRKELISSIRHSAYYWKYDLTAVPAFITKKNINSLFTKYGFDNNVGLLSIDVDGNDYWLWDAVSVIKPIIVIVEYNSIFGAKHAITIPYKENFYRIKSHYSGLYWGASLAAFASLAKKKGYVLVGTNSSGNNAYFVLKNRVGKVKPMGIRTAFTMSKYRESRNKSGELTYLSATDRVKEIKNMPVYNLQTKVVEKISKIYNL